MQPRPDHLADMTQEKWDRLTKAQQTKLRDMSEALIAHD